jgi:hypothetical protein
MTQWFAAVGENGLRPVVWGVGESEAAAREDARLALENGDARSELTMVPVSDEIAVRIQRGEVDAESLGLDTKAIAMELGHR